MQSGRDGIRADECRANGSCDRNWTAVGPAGSRSRPRRAPRRGPTAVGRQCHRSGPPVPPYAGETDASQPLGPTAVARRPCFARGPRDGRETAVRRRQCDASATAMRGERRPSVRRQCDRGPNGATPVRRQCAPTDASARADRRGPRADRRGDRPGDTPCKHSHTAAVWRSAGACSAPVEIRIPAPSGD